MRCDALSAMRITKPSRDRRHGVSDGGNTEQGVLESNSNEVEYKSPESEEQNLGLIEECISIQVRTHSVVSLRLPCKTVAPNQASLRQWGAVNRRVTKA